MQLPVAIAFGYLTDFAIWCIKSISVYSYWQQWIACIIGIILVGIGVSSEVTAGVVTLAGEGLVLAICRVTNIKFGYMKVAFDVTLVSAAAASSLFFLNHLDGVREGTLAAAICVGLLSKRFNKGFMENLCSAFVNKKAT